MGAQQQEAGGLFSANAAEIRKGYGGGGGDGGPLIPAMTKGDKLPSAK